MKQIERIRQMEKYLDKSSQSIRNLTNALENYLQTKEMLCKLTQYYESADWIVDLDADREGKFPDDLKRGVLSEDAIFDLLTENSELMRKLRETADIFI